MSVPYSDIFNKFNTLISDSVLFSDLTDEEYTELLDIFLNKSKSVHFKLLKDDLSNFESPDFYAEEYIYDGSNDFVLNQYPDNPNSDAIDLVCKINNEDVDEDNYEFDEETYTFTINYSLENYDEITCGYDFYGQFNENEEGEDIPDEVQWILATGMKLTWLERKVYSEQNLRNHWNNKDYSIHSPANLLKTLIDIKNSTQKELNRMRNSYTFNDFEGFN